MGYEHTFIATLADFLDCLTKNRPFHPNFDDAVDVQLLLEAVETSAGTGAWAQVSSEKCNENSLNPTTWVLRIFKTVKIEFSVSF